MSEVMEIMDRYDLIERRYAPYHCEINIRLLKDILTTLPIDEALNMIEYTPSLIKVREREDGPEAKGKATQEIPKDIKE